MGWPHSPRKEGWRAPERRCGNLPVAQHGRPGGWKLCGDFPPLESSPEEGIPEPFPSPARCPSFNTGLISFLPPARRCRWGRKNGPCPGGGGHPRATCHKRKLAVSWAPEPHSIGKGLNSLQGQPGRGGVGVGGAVEASVLDPRGLRLRGKVAS